MNCRGPVLLLVCLVPMLNVQRQQCTTAEARARTRRGNADATRAIISPFGRRSDPANHSVGTQTMPDQGQKTSKVMSATLIIHDESDIYI